MEWKPEHPAFQQLLSAFLKQVPTVYVVGGVVRDYLLGKPVKIADLDLVIDHPVLPAARRVADMLGWAFYPLDEARDVARLVFMANAAEPLVCDVARIRNSSVESDLRLRDFTINAMAFAVEQLGQATLIDLFGGQEDLQQNVVRRVSAASLADDPVRLLRAIRFLIQFDFTLDEQTKLQIKRVCSTVTLASAERIRDELWKMLATDQPARAIEALHEVGLLIQVLPEVAHMEGVAQSYPHFEDVYQHTLRVIQHAAQMRNWILGKPQPAIGSEMERWEEMLSPHIIALRRHFRQPVAVGHTRAEWLVWEALLHDIGKPETRSEEEQPNQSIRYRFFNHDQVGATLAENRLTMLRFSRQEIALARRVVGFHMRPHLLSSSFVGQSISKRAKFRFFRDTHGMQRATAAQEMNTPRDRSTVQSYNTSDGIDTLCLAIVDYQAIHRHANDPKEAYLIHSKELFAYIFDAAGFAATQQQPLIDGHTLMKQLQLSPGRQIGQMLAMIQEAQAAGEIETEEEALALATASLQELCKSH